MLLGLLFFAASTLAPDVHACVPARWPLTEPTSLKLMDDAPITCVLLNDAQTKPAFIAALHERKRLALAVVSTRAQAESALNNKVDALVVEGQSNNGVLRELARSHNAAFIELPARAAIDLDSTDAVVGSMQGMWPGFHEIAPDTAEAGPTAASWLDTNTGFLRYLAARVPGTPAIWIANRPPAVEPEPNALQRALCDAALSGAQWVFTPGAELVRGALAGEKKPLDAWQRLMRLLAFYRDQRALYAQPARSSLGLAIDVSAGALLSGGLADLFVAKQIPIVILPQARLSTPLPKLQALVLINPQEFNDAAKKSVADAAKAGARLIQGPPDARIEVPGDGPITFTRKQATKLDSVWNEINAMIGRGNYGARLFNASGMLSNVVGDAKTQVVHIVNYTDYPVTEVTVSVPGKPKSVRWVTPQGERKPSDQFEVDDGTAILLDKIEDAGLLVIER